VDSEGISDDDMKRLLASSRPYTVVLLRPGPKRHEAGADKIVWEHGRRNMALRAAGTLSVVLPIGSPDVSGIGIFNCDVDATRAIMQGDPGVQAGVFVYDLYESRGFPGDALPA
jgi:hypothetical protein